MTETRETLADSAALWVARMDRAEWSVNDEADLELWLSGDRRRRGALLQAQAAWMTLDRSIRDLRPTPTPVAWTIRRRRFLQLGGPLIAASVIAGFIWEWRSDRYSTIVGEVRRVPLTDGSVATINTNSKLTVTFERDQRLVNLVEGEAWFHVTKDAKRPFLVDAGQVRVRAVGTAFSVRRQDDGVVILVSEGVVETSIFGAHRRPTRVAAGQRLFIARTADIAVTSATPSEIDRSLAWRSGKIDLRGTSLSAAVAEFSRYTKQRLVIGDPALASERLDGVFRVDDPKSFAVAAGASLKVPVDLSRADVIVIGEPPHSEQRI